MPSKQFVLWTDIETTGNQPDSGLIEIGLVLTDASPNLDVIADAVVLITEPIRGTVIGNIDPFVIAMHANNGLWQELIQPTAISALPELQIENYVRASHYNAADEWITGWLDRATKGEKQHIPLAGSGVSHFDRQYIRKYLPKTDKRLTYWHYDIGVIRRMTALAGLPLNTEFVKQKPHRALQDAYLAADEARMWIARQRVMAGQ